MRRRQFLKQFVHSTAGISASQFLAYFMNFGLPAASRADDLAADQAREADAPRFLLYWFVEGGWMGYDMFNPVMTPNHVLQRSDDISHERYRVLHWGEENYGIYTQGNIRYGYLAEEGVPLFSDMAVLSSMHTGGSHSRERLRAHMGTYDFRSTAERQEDERSIMQAFAEVCGQPYVLPNLSWHWWLSDGELNEAQYTGRRGYYHALGPSYAHTIYAGPPDNLRGFLERMRRMSTDAVNRQVQNFLDSMDGHLLHDSSSEVVKSYHSARSIYQNLANQGGKLDENVLRGLFNQKSLKEQFNVQPADELITYRSINGNKARTKFSPGVNVQAMMTYELLCAGYSSAFWLETRDIRLFDDHYTRRALWKPDGTPKGQPDTTNKMNSELWKPLKTLVQLLKNTEYKQTGKSLYDLTTIVLTSEFGRTIHGEVEAIEKMKIPDAEKKKLIGEQDISQHWPVTSAVFLGGNVKGGYQYGGVGELTLQPIPILPDGSMDPAYDPKTGVLLEGREKNEKSMVPDHGEVYATALSLCGIDPKGKGRNEGRPLSFIHRT